MARPNQAVPGRLLLSSATAHSSTAHSSATAQSSMGDSSEWDPTEPVANIRLPAPCDRDVRTALSFHASGRVRGHAGPDERANIPGCGFEDLPPPDSS
jgi:hypothetical protein